MEVGFVGLGKMGRPMALNLLRAGFDLVVHNRSRGVVAEMVDAGAKAADAPCAVAARCDVVLTCLPDTAAVEQVYLADEGLGAGARPGQVFVDHSTVGPSTSRQLAAALQEKGASFLDGPVSGGTAGAQSGTLTIMVGGDAAAFATARPILAALGKNIHHVGPSGAGSVIKLANQLLVAINMAGAVEALVLGVKAGADPRVMLEVLSTSFGGSAMLDRAVPLILQRKFEPGTPINLILKDLGLIAALGKETTVRLILGSLAEEIFTEARASGLGQLDMAALVQPLERLSGVEIG